MRKLKHIPAASNYRTLKYRFGANIHVIFYQYITIDWSCASDSLYILYTITRLLHVVKKTHVVRPRLAAS